MPQETPNAWVSFGLSHSMTFYLEWEGPWYNIVCPESLSVSHIQTATHLSILFHGGHCSVERTGQTCLSACLLATVHVIV